MSTAAIRIPAAQAGVIAESLTRRWGMVGPSYVVVGSLRRGLPTIGDIDIVAPMPTDKRDPLYERMAADIQPAEGLFTAATPREYPVCAKSGFKPGFRFTSLELKLRQQGDPVGSIGVQIHRYDAGDQGNKGWIVLMRTGPHEFGQWFLGKWKRTWAFPAGQEASVGGYLVDRWGKPVPTPEERTCFDLCGLKFMEPGQRDEVSKRVGCGT